MANITIEVTFEDLTNGDLDQVESQVAEACKSLTGYSQAQEVAREEDKDKD